MRGVGVPGRGPRRCGRSRGGVTSTRALFGALEKMIKGEPGERTRQQYQNQVAAVNSFAPAVAALSDEQLRGKTAEFKGRLAGGATLEQLLPEAFAVRVATLCALCLVLWRCTLAAEGRVGLVAGLTHSLGGVPLLPAGGAGGCGPCVGPASV